VLAVRISFSLELTHEMIFSIDVKSCNLEI
jgi:hypothetical protein